MVKSKNKNINYKWTPLIFIVLYVIGTLFISLFGPIQYNNYTFYNKFLVSVYAIAFIIFTWIGMLVGFKKNVKFSKNKKVVFQSSVNIISFIVLVIKILLILSCIKLYGIPRFSNLFETMTLTYNIKSLGGFSEKNIFRQIDTFTTFLYIISLCGALYDWKNIKKRIKVVLYTNMLLTVIYTIFYIGDMKPIMDIVIYVLSAVLVTYLKKGKKIFRFRNVIALLLVSVIAIFFFSSIVMSRRTSWGRSQSDYLGNFMTLNIEHPLLSGLPTTLKYQIGSFLIYPTMGWYGLSLALQLPFKWTYFIGGARGLNNIVSQFIPSIPDMYSQTYLGRMEAQFGYDGLSNWHTIFPWLASDLTFIGALLYMGFVAYIYAVSLKEAIEYNNPISFIMLSILNIMYLFLTANNQLFTQRGSAVSTIIILFIWISKHKNYNEKV